MMLVTLVVIDFTVTFILAGPAHSPAFGVNVYVVVPIAEVLIVAGFQVPLIPLVETDGNCGAVEFWHKGAIGVNTGITC